MTMRLGVEAVCVMVGMSRATLLRAVGRGAFPAGQRFGRRVLWTADAVEDWLKRERRDGPATGPAVEVRTKPR